MTSEVRMRSLLAVFAMCITTTTTSAAQDSVRTIDPGMSRTQVVEHLGAPVSEKSDGAYTFLYYRNGCEKTCGMQDLVVLENNAVVDAIFRAKTRRYTGQSSSPNIVPPKQARTHQPATLTVGGPAARSSAPSKTVKPKTTSAADSARAPNDTIHHHP